MLLKTNTIKKISLLLSFIIIYLSKYAYSQEIHFSSLEYDYGTIKEEEGPKKGSFTFTNTGDDTLKILTVKPSCGCTASDYTKDPIPPGGQGFINAIYNPTGRPGKFSKAISVVSNSKTQPNITLIIKGEVIPRPKSKADLYPFSIGNLKLTKTNISFNDIKNTQSKTDTIKVYNISKNSISIVFPSLPSFLKVEAQPVLLEPSQEGLII
ncbi:MAG TPA: DUF1573 domain-containing protein, partial [Bacteroidales bacterium]|nr:DUF1573 domain-containing protein [Bacteroidales bacterium]